MAFLVRFVDRITASPTTRLDLMAAPWRVLADGTDVSPPQLDRQMVSTLLTDGVRIPAAAYGHRTIRLNLQLSTSTADAAADAFQQLARELDRASNILMWQPTGSSSPVFFKTFRSDPGQIGEFLRNWTTKTITINIPAEPFALGLKVTGSPVTVANDPEAANGLYFDVTGIQGDVETPAILTMPGTALPLVSTMQTAIGVRRRGTPSAIDYFVQAEDGTLEPNSTLPGNDAAMSGTGSNYVRVTPGSSLMERAILWSPLAGASVDLRGTYRVFARTRRSSSTGSINLQLRWGYTSGTMIENPKAPLALGTSRLMVDLGLFQVPIGFDPVTDSAGVEYSVNSIDLALYIERLSGTSTVDIDYLALVPADDRLAIIQWPKYNSAIATLITDTAESNVFGVTSGGAVTSTTFPNVVGGLPMLSPGVVNRLVFVRQVYPFDANTLADTTQVTVSHFPRYLYVRPAAS